MTMKCRCGRTMKVEDFVTTLDGHRICMVCHLSKKFDDLKELLEQKEAELAAERKKKTVYITTARGRDGAMAKLNEKITKLEDDLKAASTRERGLMSLLKTEAEQMKQCPGPNPGMGCPIIDKDAPKPSDERPRCRDCGQGKMWPMLWCDCCGAAREPDSYETGKKTEEKRVGDEYADSGDIDPEDAERGM